MGKKGDKLTNDSVESTELLLNKLASIEGVTSKKMFGGHGIFHEKKMFGIVNSKGQCYFKVDESTKFDYENEGAHKHSKMPYYSLPKKLLTNKDLLVEWANKSITISK